jgi:hypothetical protein
MNTTKQNTSWEMDTCSSSQQNPAPYTNQRFIAVL